jgi:uncharacterized protein YabE (DUF348 family)
LNFIKQIQSLKMYKHRLVSIAGIACFVAVMGFVCAFNLYKDINVVVDPNQPGVVSETLTLSRQNMNQTVGEVLSNNQIDTNDYSVDQPLDASIRDVDTITLKKMASGNITTDGHNVIYESGAATVGDLLAENGITLGENDYVTPSADTALTSDVQEIKVDRVEVVEETRDEEIPFEIQNTEDKSLPAATTQISTPGQNGMKSVTEKVRYLNGERVDSEVVSETVTTEPVAQVQTQNSTGIATTGHKTYTVSDSDFQLICAIVQHEAGNSYDSVLAVMSTVLNRADAGNWGGGSDPVGILTASGQFESYFGGYYTQLLGNTADFTQQAVRDCLNGTRNHDYQRFRSYETTGSVQIAGGNYYF